MKRIHIKDEINKPKIPCARNLYSNVDWFKVIFNSILFLNNEYKKSQIEIVAARNNDYKSNPPFFRPTNTENPIKTANKIEIE